MNAAFIDPTRRVILPRTGEGCRGLLIPEAVVVLNNIQKRVTPSQYIQLSGRPDAHCPCGVQVHLTQAHRVDGSFHVPDHFKTKAGHEHAPECGYHFRKAARDLDREEHEYDVTKPYRIHLNFMDDVVSHASLARGTGLFYDRDNHGLPINESCKDWQPVSLNSIEKLISFVSGADPKRLKDSVVILNQQAISWHKFCLSNRTPHRWTHLYNDLSREKRFLKLFMLQKTNPEQIDLFKKPSSYIPRDQVFFEQNDRSMILRPCLRTSDDTVELCARTGVVLILSIPERLQGIVLKSDRTLIANIPIPAQSRSLVGHLPVYPHYKAPSSSP